MTLLDNGRHTAEQRGQIKTCLRYRARRAGPGALSVGALSVGAPTFFT